jgi:AcrR family transcriptional regulator
MPRLLTPARVADFRNRLCDVAMQLLAEVGYDGFNMRELAARLGVSAMTAYRYFKDKDEILAAVRLRALDRLADRLEAANDKATAAAGRWAAVSRVYIDFARQEPIYYRLMFETTLGAADLSPDQQKAELRVRMALGDSSAASAKGEPAKLSARLLWSTLHGIALLHLGGRFSSVESEQLLAESLRVLGKGYSELAGAESLLAPPGDLSAVEPSNSNGEQHREGVVALSAAG